MDYWKKPMVAALAALLALTACSDGEADGTTYEPADYEVKGKVEKGPFVSGTTINLQPMDARLQPNGSTFSTTVADHLGNFSFGTRTLEAPFAQLTANGYFFNEVKGRLSDGTLSLRAVVNVADEATVNVNILTHLKYPRILNLVEKDGKTFDEANHVAQKELLGAFGLGRLSDTDVSKYSIAAGTDEAAALIAISSLILKGRSEAEVTEYLARLSLEFGETGAFSVETKERMRKDRADLLSELDNIANNVVSRYADLKQTVTVKPLKSFFDWDDDGVAGNEFLDPDNMPEASQTEFLVPKEGGEYTVEVASPVQLYTTVPTLDGSEPYTWVTTEEFFDALYDGSEAATPIASTYNDGKLKITVGRTAYRNTKEHKVLLYDILGTAAVSVTLTQEGDPAMPQPKLGNDGKAVVAAIVQDLANAMFNATFFVNDYESRKPLSADNSEVSKMWKSFYSAIGRINLLSYADAQRRNAFEANLSVLSALCYYNMVTLWGDVPVTTYNPDIYVNYTVPRTSQALILNTLAQGLENAVNALEEKKNAFDNIDNLFGVSKDVARVLLAHVYMYEGNYSNACTLLSKVKSNGFYSLASGNGTSMVQEEETIFGLISSNGHTRSVIVTGDIPVISYPDVLLSLAECHHHLGNSAIALQILDDLASAKELKSGATDVPHRIKDYRRQMNNMPGYFAYMKRAGLAQPEMDLQGYQLLFPIPAEELLLNVALTQNAGY